MQLLNEHLKLSLIICLVVYGNHYANAFFFFSLQHCHDVGKKKALESAFFKKNGEDELSRLLPTLLFYDAISSSVILYFCSLLYYLCHYLWFFFFLSKKKKGKL